MPSAQQSARECADYIKEVYDNPLGSFKLKLGLTDEGSRVRDKHDGSFTEDMIMWKVDPCIFSGIEVRAKPDIYSLVCALLDSERIPYRPQGGGVFVVLP